MKVAVHNFIHPFFPIHMPISPKISPSTPPTIQPAINTPRLNIEDIVIDEEIRDIHLQGDGLIFPALELTLATRDNNSQYPVIWTIPEPQQTNYEITWLISSEFLWSTDTDSDNRQSDEILSPIHLLRTDDASVPMRISARHTPELQDIAGPPLNRSLSENFGPRVNFETGSFSHTDNSGTSLQLSTFNSDYLPLPLPSPEFDSTHRIIRIPVQGSESERLQPPQDRALSESPDEEANPSPFPTASHFAGPIGTLRELMVQQRAGNSDALGDNQVEFGSPRYAQVLSSALGNAWQSHASTQPIDLPVPNSAPPVLHRLPAVRLEIQVQQTVDGDDVPTVSCDTDSVELVGSHNHLAM